MFIQMTNLGYLSPDTFSFVWGERRKRWKGGTRQRKTRDCTRLLYLTSHQQYILVDNLRLVILLNSVNILFEYLPWTGYCADSGEISGEYIYFLKFF